MTQEELIKKDVVIADIISRGYFYKANLNPAIVKAIEETVFYVFDIARIEHRKIKLTPASVSLKLGKWSNNAVFKLMKYEKNKTVSYSSKYFDNGNYTRLKVFTDLKEAEDAYKIAIQNSIVHVDLEIDRYEKIIVDLEAIKDELEDGSKMYI